MEQSAGPPPIENPPSSVIPVPGEGEKPSPAGSGAQSIDDQCARFDRDLEESRRECEDLRARLEVEKTRVNELTHEHQGKNERIRVMEQEVEKLRTRLTDVVQLEKQWQAREEEWVSKVSSLEDKLQLAETKAVSLQKNLSVAQQEVTSLRSESSTDKQATLQLKDAMKAARGDNEKVALELEELRLMLQSKEEDLQVELEQVRNACTVDITEEREKRNSLEAELEQTRQEITSLQEQVRVAEETIRRSDRLRAELDSREAEKKGLEEELQHHKDEIESLNKKLDDQNLRFDKVRLIFRKKNKMIDETGELLEKRDLLVKELREKLGNYEYWDKNNKFLLQNLQDQLTELNDSAKILGIKKFVDMSGRLGDTLSQIQWE